jgi:hypothetical protein
LTILPIKPSFEIDNTPQFDNERSNVPGELSKEERAQCAALTKEIKAEAELATAIDDAEGAKILANLAAVAEALASSTAGSLSITTDVLCSVLFGAVLEARNDRIGITGIITDALDNYLRLRRLARDGARFVAFLPDGSEKPIRFDD